MSANHSMKEWLLLSSYIDGELNEREKKKLEQLLRASPDLQNELEQLRQTRTMIRSMPRKQAPKNFTLTPEMAAERKPKLLVPIFSLSSVASAVVALILLFIQFLPGFFASSQPAFLAKEAQVEMAMPAQDAVELESEPAIIYWEGPPGQFPAEGKGGGGLTEESAPAEPMMEAAPNAQQPPVEKEGIAAEEEVAEAVPEEAIVEEAEVIEAEPAEESSLAESSTPETTIIEGEQRDDEGPILGIRPTEELGQMIVPTPRQIEEEKQSPFWFIEVALLLFAFASGVTAFVLWRRTR